MRVLWLCNIILPQIAEVIGKPVVVRGGWLVGLANVLSKTTGIELTVSFPLIGEHLPIKGRVDQLHYYGFPQKASKSRTEEYFEKIIQDVQPDVIHVWGTEYSHTLAMVNTCEKLGYIDKVTISIQGLCSIISKHFSAGLPNYAIKRSSIRNFIFRDNIKQQTTHFKKRGINEIKAIKKVKHIIGRTELDKAFTSQINRKAIYYFCNETLRNTFYEEKWDIKDCEKFSIFVSQGNTPIKGLHFVIEALPEILKRFPDTCLYVAGTDVTRTGKGFKEALKVTYYGKYIKKLIKRNKLEGKVAFTGNLNETKMCEKYLKTHVFVCPSSIENSPNSLGEAMILGVPSIASYVGGVPDLLKHNEEGFLYQQDAPYMLAHYICKVFEDEKLAEKISNNARDHATKTHNREVNLYKLIEIYKTISLKN